MGRRSPTARYWSGLCGWARLGLAEHWTVRRPTPETRSLPRRRWARTMASVGIRKRVSARPGRVTYQVWWLLEDGSQGAQTVATPAIARELQAEKQLEIARGSWQGRRRGRLTFDRWADEWWAVWSTDPDRSPTTLAATENRLRRHIRPWFGQRPLEAIRPMLIRRWQNQLAGQVGPESLMACRSILFRILQLAEDEGAIAANPVRKVPAPKRQVDPERVFADGRSRSCRWSTPATKPVGSAVASSPAQERRRHPRDPPGSAGGRGDPPSAAARCRLERPRLCRSWRREWRALWDTNDPVAPRLSSSLPERNPPRTKRSRASSATRTS